VRTVYVGRAAQNDNYFRIWTTASRICPFAEPPPFDRII